MQANKIVELIENFAPLELQASWDNSGWAVEIEGKDIKKVLLALSVTESVVKEALQRGCDMIISHHPMFYVPYELNRGVSIYTAHTNLDKAQGGTTDTIISLLGFENPQTEGEFLRVVELDEETTLNEFVKRVKDGLQLENIRVVNNLNCERIKKIAFCAGSGADLLAEAQSLGADVFLTGDIKYHAALESKIIMIDIEHFESERPVLKTLQNVLTPLNLEVSIADEKSPFSYIWFFNSHKSIGVSDCNS